MSFFALDKGAGQVGYIAQVLVAPFDIKIGRAASARTRVMGLRAGMPFDLRLVAVIENGERFEREVKARFPHLRIKGEWYRAGPAWRDFIAEMAGAGRLLKQVIDFELTYHLKNSGVCWDDCYAAATEKPRLAVGWL